MYFITYVNSLIDKRLCRSTSAVTYGQTPPGCRDSLGKSRGVYSKSKEQKSEIGVVGWGQELASRCWKKEVWREIVNSLKNYHRWRNPERNAKTETGQLMRTLKELHVVSLFWQSWRKGFYSAQNTQPGSMEKVCSCVGALCKAVLQRDKCKY